MSDPHQVVVDHVCEVVGRVPIRFEEHLVVDLVIGDHDVAAEEIVRHRFALSRHRETNDMFFARCDAALRFFAVNRPTQSVVAESSLGGLLLGAQLLETLAGAETRIGRALCHQLLDVLEIDFGSLALTVRPKLTADVGAFIPLETQP